MAVTYALDAPHADARVIWIVIDNDTIVGKVGEFGVNDWRIRDAGIGVSFNRNARYTTRDAAAEALIDIRATAPIRRLTESGLTVLQEQVLWHEGQRLEKQLTGTDLEAHRLQAASGLGIHLTTYLQTLRGLLDDGRAKAYAPITTSRLRAERDHSRARRHDPTRRPRQDERAA